jgi:predicted amidophosphoribosyltransferase
MSEMTEVKKCSKCNIIYYVDGGFWKSSKTKDGLKPQCINCVREWKDQTLTCDMCGKSVTKATNARHKYNCLLKQEARAIGVPVYIYYVIDGIEKHPMETQRGVKYMFNPYNAEEWRQILEKPKSMDKDLYTKIHTHKTNAKLTL